MRRQRLHRKAALARIPGSGNANRLSSNSRHAHDGG
jgi:hypothetical protein